MYACESWDAAGDVTVKISHNAAIAWPECVVQQKIPAMHDFTLVVKKDDTVSFSASKHGAAADRIAWDPVITFVDSQVENGVKSKDSESVNGKN